MSLGLSNLEIQRARNYRTEQTILEMGVEQSQTLATVPKVAVELAEIVPAVLKLQ